MQDRGITFKGDTRVAMRLRENNHVLLVVLRECEGKSKVITVIDTSKIEKYF